MKRSSSTVANCNEGIVGQNTLYISKNTCKTPKITIIHIFKARSRREGVQGEYILYSLQNHEKQNISADEFPRIKDVSNTQVLTVLLYKRYEPYTSNVLDEMRASPLPVCRVVRPTTF